MTPANTYQPTDEFREHLEREVLRRYRRNTREQMRRPVRRPRLAKAAAIVIVSASLGATAGFASAQIGQGGVRDSLLAAARAAAMLAQTRFDIAKAEAGDVTAKVRVGMANQETLAAATAELRDMEARRNAMGVNIDEISASGRRHG
ncbi:MAG: hypothetical protein ABJF01_16390 [bacterium]